MAVITQMVTVLAAQNKLASTSARPQFKNALITLAHEAALMIPDDPKKGRGLFEDILRSIARVKYYRPKKKRPAYPRPCKQHPTKWTLYREEKLANA